MNNLQIISLSHLINTLYICQYQDEQYSYWHSIFKQIAENFEKIKKNLNNGIIDLKNLEFFKCIHKDGIHHVLQNNNDLENFENLFENIFRFYKEKKKKIKSISLGNCNLAYKSFSILKNLIIKYNSESDIFIELKKISLCGNFLNNSCLELLCDILSSFPENYKSLEELKLGCFEFGQLGENINDNGFKNLIELIKKRPEIFSNVKTLKLDALKISIKSVHDLTLPKLNYLSIGDILENSSEDENSIIFLHEVFENLYKRCPSLKVIKYYIKNKYFIKNKKIIKELEIIKEKMNIKKKKFNILKFNHNIEQKICPITKDNFKENENILQTKNCNHIFSESAILEWLIINKKKECCPLCRKTL